MFWYMIFLAFKPNNSRLEYLGRWSQAVFTFHKLNITQLNIEQFSIEHGPGLLCTSIWIVRSIQKSFRGNSNVTSLHTLRNFRYIWVKEIRLSQC